MKMEKLQTIKHRDYAEEKEAICAGANVSKKGVAYFPFEDEKETIDWIEDMTSEWWDDETISIQGE